MLYKIVRESADRGGFEFYVEHFAKDDPNPTPNGRRNRKYRNEHDAMTAALGAAARSSIVLKSIPVFMETTTGVMYEIVARKVQL